MLHTVYSTCVLIVVYSELNVLVIAVYIELLIIVYSELNIVAHSILNM